MIALARRATKLYLPISRARLEAGLREDGRTTADLAAAELEARAVPGTDDHVAFSLAFVQVGGAANP